MKTGLIVGAIILGTVFFVGGGVTGGYFGIDAAIDYQKSKNDGNIKW